MQLTHALQEDIPALIAIWRECFGDEEDYLDFYFRNRFVPEDTLLVREDGAPVAMLTLMNVTRNGKSGFYIYAVATLPACQGRGLQRRLSSWAEEIMRQRGGSFCCLVPAEEYLFRFYEKLGFRPGFARWEKKIKNDSSFDLIEFYPCSFKNFRELRTEYLNSIPNALVHPDRELGYIYQELCCCGGQVLRFYEGEKLCYAAYSFDADSIYLREQTGSDPERVAQALMDLHSVSEAVVTSHLSFPGAKKREWVMAKDLFDGENTVAVGHAALMLD